MKVILSCSVLLSFAAIAAASDPTRPDVGLAQQLTEQQAVQAIKQHQLRLNLIKEVAGQPLAMINGKAVRIGEQIDGFQVVAIQAQQVQLQQGEQTIWLPLFKMMKTND